MNGRMLTVLTAIAGILALGEFASSIVIWQDHLPGGLPLGVAVLAVFFLIAAWLLRSGRIRTGAIVAGILCLFEVVNFPSWPRHGALEWTSATAFALVSLAGLITAIVVLAARLRRGATA